MKQIQDIVREHIERVGAHTDNASLIRYAQELEARLAKRNEADPSLTIFVRHYADALAAALTVVPEPMKPYVIKNLLMQVIVEWEDVHEEFNKQLSPHT